MRIYAVPPNTRRRGVPISEDSIASLENAGKIRVPPLPEVWLPNFSKVLCWKMLVSPFATATVRTATKTDPGGRNESDPENRLRPKRNSRKHLAAKVSVQIMVTWAWSDHDFTVRHHSTGMGMMTCPALTNPNLHRFMAGSWQRRYEPRLSSIQREGGSGAPDRGPGRPCGPCVQGSKALGHHNVLTCSANLIRVKRNSWIPAKKTPPPPSQKWHR